MTSPVTCTHRDPVVMDTGQEHGETTCFLLLVDEKEVDDEGVVGNDEEEGTGYLTPLTIIGMSNSYPATCRRTWIEFKNFCEHTFQLS